MRLVSADAVRAAIADHVLGEVTNHDTLGDIALFPHQRDGLERIRRLLQTHRGALLADEAGLGKTYVALAVARDAANTIVVAPAAIRDAWLAAAQRARVPVRFVSVEALSRGASPGTAADLVIVDEAHHLRSPSTRRFAAASLMCRDARVLLISATPVQNSTRDLRTILSLFLGASAHAIAAEELARLVVRRAAFEVARPGVPAVPRLEAPQWIGPIADVDCLERLLALPRAVPPSDGDDGGVLLTYTLVRQWSSSRGALCSALRRRVARARAIEDALAAGHLPSRAELSAWCFADGAQQLAFPELAASTIVPEATALLDQIRNHRDAVCGLLAWLATTPDPDRARVDALHDVMQRHHEERVVAFSEYADTIGTLYRAMSPRARVAMLTHGGGRVVGGTMSRRELLARFTPGASARTHDRERIDLLLTTDVLSEGVDLHDASVVVHLDLSWNPARLEQRVGRLRRLGATRDRVHVYLMEPPAPAERLLGLERRLRLKLGDASRSVGIAGAILPGLVIEPHASTAPREERIAKLLRGWRAESAPAGPVAATVAAGIDGALAVVRRRDDVSLVGVVDGRVTDTRSSIENLASAALGETRETDPIALRQLRESIEGWLCRRSVSDVVDLPALRLARSRRALLHRVEVIARRLPRHARPQMAPLMRAARATAAATLPAGAERVLEEISGSPMDDVAWLRAIGEFAALHARDAVADPPGILALLILRRE